jgi:hypothetical protein
MSTPQQRLETDAVARFWAKVNKNGPVPSHCPELGACWIWTGFCDADGYGHFKWGDRSPGAHRVSWQIHYGPVPEDKPCVLHRCDNPSCVRSDHLWIGTNADNAADRVRKGRGRGAVGERNRNATLIEGDVLTIRRKVAAGEKQVAMARRYEVSRVAIHLICRRKTWRHVL